VVAPGEAEQARARLLELYPGGFEERESGRFVELSVYADGDDSRLREAFGEVRVEEVADDWADRWREFHRPVRIGPLWVGPPWQAAPGDAVAVVIEPGQAFGTGAHPTTRLCLELLLDVARGSLLDVGCGSGVLSIAAAGLGFGPVTAVDVDPAAVEATGVNAAANGVDVAVRLVDALAGPALPVTDVAVANIALEAVAAVAPRLVSPVLIASGYLERDHPSPRGYERRRRATAGGWAADLYLRK
jgi:ribosomal protein L11 methyltransferase